MSDRALPFPLPVVPPRFTPLTAAAQNRKLAQQLYARFFSWPIERSRKILETTPPEVWEREGQKRALHIFHEAAERVPAYRDFLKKYQVDPAKIQTIGDFKAVPPMDKNNYLKQYSLKELSWDGILNVSHIISVSSGSTGTPFFWPRGITLELETTQIFELFLEVLFETNSRSTLFVNAFAMGMYVGGPITLNSVLRVAQKHNNLTIVTPGYSLDDILRVISELGPQYDQIVLASYPPFAKDIIDEGIQQGISWQNFDLKLLLAGEGFNEGWRDYVAELAGKRNVVRHFINLYGTADAAILGHETPFSVMYRRAFNKNARVRKQIFGDERLPSLLQYYPTLRYFEVLEEELIFTASAGVPLIRYNIHDRGGIFSWNQIQETAGRLEFDYNEMAKTMSVNLSRWQLPCAFIFGRSDFTSVLYGANVYPENIRAALEEPSIRSEVSGKFTMFTETDRRQNQRLLINIECASEKPPRRSFSRDLQRAIIKTLLEMNSEYKVVHHSVGKKTWPVIKLFSRGDPKYFARGTKHLWTRKPPSLKQ